jgi:hypothetical protein
MTNYEPPAMLRRTVALAAVTLPAIGLVEWSAKLQPVYALAGLDLVAQCGSPSALARPLWTDVGAANAAGWPAAGRIIRREQRAGVLRTVLGPHPARLVQLGPLQARGRTIGVTALLSLPVPRHHVRATVPGVGTASSGPRATRVRFTAPVLRDVLVDVNLRRGAIVAVTPGPASRTSAWSADTPRSPSPNATGAAQSAHLVRLSRGGPSFSNYDGTKALGARGRDWPVSLVFTGHATVGKVKKALRSVGFTHRGDRRWLAYRTVGGTVRYDGDRGLKTACDANGTDVHLRLYAPPGTDHFTDPRFGSVVVATAHFDRGEGRATPPLMFGFSEAAEGRVADALARVGWRMQRNAVALGNAERYRRDLAAPDHVWWSNGRATLIRVP